MTPQKLQSWRNKNNYSQSQLAKVLGVAVMTVSRWERGVREIPPFLHLTLKGLKKGGIMSRRSSYMKYDEEIEIGKRPVYIWGYDTNDKFVCRLGINSAGISVDAGTKGQRPIGDYTWEAFVKKLTS